jgi:heme/copper-type cytochrome/quinol oxidase subunit 2
VIVVFTAEDIAHSFTISDDHYRIDRRAEPGKPATFRFRADKPGTFEIRCTLTIDDRCLREMRAKFIVVGK